MKHSCVVARKRLVSWYDLVEESWRLHDTNNSCYEPAITNAALVHVIAVDLI